MEVPISLKKIKPYLERANELQSKDPVVAYHCRLYALQEAIRIRATLPKEDMGFVMTLMDTLEKEKGELGDIDNPSVLVENFAQDLFQRADDADRAGQNDLRTGRAFIVASQLFDVCKQFDELPADLVEKAKYAKWRFVEITKASKEGRAPAPPRGVEPEDAPIAPPPPEMPTEPGPPAIPPVVPPAQDAYGLPPTAYPPPAPPPAAGAAEPETGGLPSYMGLPMAPAPAALAPPPAYTPPAAPAYPPPQPMAGFGPPGPMAVPPGGMPGFGAAPQPTRGPSFTPDRAAMVEAQRLCSSATSALQFQDHETAVHQLHMALQMLTQPRATTPTPPP